MHVTFVMNIISGVVFGADCKAPAHQVATLLSNRARRHMWTRGKRDSSGSTCASVAVTLAHDVNIRGLAEAGGVLERDLRYGSTAEDKTCLTSA